MKFFAVRDRMIDYFLTPFAAPNDNEALAGVAQEVNRTDVGSAIQNTPHHFELYSLGEIDDNGIITPKKELICDISTLVRPRRTAAESGATQTPSPAGNREAGTH